MGHLFELKLTEPGRAAAFLECSESISVVRPIDQGHSQFRKPVPHPLQALLDLCRGSGIRKPNMVSGTESFARNCDHVGFMQESPGYVSSGIDPLPAKIRRNVGVDVKCA